MQSEGHMTVTHVSRTSGEATGQLVEEKVGGDTRIVTIDILYTLCLPHFDGLILPCSGPLLILTLE